MRVVGVPANVLDVALVREDWLGWNVADPAEGKGLAWVVSGVWRRTMVNEGSGAVGRRGRIRP